MSTQWLPNMNRILSAARTYKRACGKVRNLERKLQVAVKSEQEALRRLIYGEYCKAVRQKDDTASRLLWIIETGEKSLAKMKP